jgi:hypothetical protein
MRSHEQTVHTQFDPRAEAYLLSAVHAAGPDLKHTQDLLDGVAGACSERSMSAAVQAICLLQSPRTSGMSWHSTHRRTCSRP